MKILQERAGSFNLKLSEYVYNAALGKSVKVDNPKFAKDVSEMLAVSRNLNQIAKVANKMQFVPKSFLKDLDECLALIRKTLSDL